MKLSKAIARALLVMPVLGLVGARPATAEADSSAKPQRCPSSCSDGNPCTMDACSASTGFQCTHTPLTCTAPDRCHGAGTCDTSTGLCLNPPGHDGAACDDGNACTSADACAGGVCTGAPRKCPSGTCNRNTGA